MFSRKNSKMEKIFEMEKNGCSFRKMPGDLLETFVKVFKHQIKTPIANRRYSTRLLHNY